MSGEIIQKGPPRSNQDSQRTAIFRAAETVLVAFGYQKTTTLAIAKASGISKHTLYNHFPSKEELFAALIEDRTKIFNDALTLTFEDTSLPLAGVLKTYARYVLSLLTSDIVIAINRAAMTTASSGDLGFSTLYFKYGYEPSQAKVKAILEAARTDGILAFDDIEDTVQTLSGLIHGDLRLRRLLGVAAIPDDEQIADLADKAIAKFYKLFAPMPSD